MKILNNKKFIEICNEITETCDCKNGYCFYRQLVESQKPSIRLLVQLECIEKYKYEQSEKLGKDIGHSNAAMLWVEEGLAKAFADVYDEDLTIKQIYKLTLEKIKKVID